MNVFTYIPIRNGISKSKSSETSGPGRAFDKCPGRARALGVAGRVSLISPGVAGRGSACDPATLPTLTAGGPPPPPPPSRRPPFGGAHDSRF